MKRHSQAFYTAPGCTPLEGKLESQCSADLPCEAPSKAATIHITAVQTTRLLIPNKMPNRQGSCPYLCNNPVRYHFTGQLTLPSHAVRCSWGIKPSEENSSKKNQNSLTVYQYRYQKHTQPHALCPTHTLLQAHPLSHSSLRPSTPWDEPQALQTCPAQGPLSPRATAFSRNHKTTRGSSQVQETHSLPARPEPCDSLLKDKYNWGSHCLWREAKNIFL